MNEHSLQTVIPDSQRLVSALDETELAESIGELIAIDDLSS